MFRLQNFLHCAIPGTPFKVDRNVNDASKIREHPTVTIIHNDPDNYMEK